MKGARCTVITCTQPPAKAIHAGRLRRLTSAQVSGRSLEVTLVVPPKHHHAKSTRPPEQHATYLAGPLLLCNPCPASLRWPVFGHASIGNLSVDHLDRFVEDGVRLSLQVDGLEVTRHTRGLVVPHCPCWLGFTGVANLPVNKASVRQIESTSYADRPWVATQEGT